VSGFDGFQTNSREVEAWEPPVSSHPEKSFRRTLVRLKQLMSSVVGHNDHRFRRTLVRLKPSRVRELRQGLQFQTNSREVEAAHQAHLIQGRFQFQTNSREVEAP